MSMERNCLDLTKELNAKDFSYADLVASFRTLSTVQRVKVTKNDASFLDWLISKSNGLTEDNAKKYSSKICQLVCSKIKLLLAASGSLSISELQMTLLQSSGFISNTFLNNLIAGDDFEIIPNRTEKYVKLRVTEAPINKDEKENVKKTKTPNNLKLEQMKVLFRSNPGVVACLSPAVTWSLLLKAHGFWEEFCMHSSASFIGWLQEMAKLNDLSQYPQYITNLRLCIANRCRLEVGQKQQTINEVTNRMCLTVKKFITADLVYEACQNAKLDLEIVVPDQTASVSNYILRPVGSPIKTIISSAVKTTRQDPLNPFHTLSLKPCESSMIKLQNLLTLKVKLSNLVGNFHAIKRSDKHLILDIAFHYGCFLQFLIVLFEYYHPTMEVLNFEHALQVQLRQPIDEHFAIISSVSDFMKNIVASLSLGEFVDEGLIVRTLAKFPEKYILSVSVVCLRNELANRKILYDEDMSSLLNLCEDLTHQLIIQSYVRLPSTVKDTLLQKEESFCQLLRTFYTTFPQSEVNVMQNSLCKVLYEQISNIVVEHQCLPIDKVRLIISEGLNGIFAKEDILWSIESRTGNIVVINDMLSDGLPPTGSSMLPDTSVSSKVNKNEKKKNLRKSSKRKSSEPSLAEEKKKSCSKSLSDSKPCNSKDTNDAFLSTHITNMSDSLIQDVSMGRLLASSDNQMFVTDLVECLSASLFTHPQRDMLKSSLNLCREFCRKVVECLLTVDQLEIFETTHNDHTAVKVKLIINAQKKVEELKTGTLPVFRSLSRLTGVSNRKLAFYIKTTCTIDDKPIPVALLFKMCQQKYASNYAYPDMSPDIINCQVASCLSADQKIFVDITNLTCCQRAKITDPREYNNLWDMISEERCSVISSFLVEILSMKCYASGCPLENLVVLLKEKFEQDFQHLEQESVMLYLQSLVGRIDGIGLTTTGQVAKLPQNQLEYRTPSSDDSDHDLDLDLKENNCVSSQRRETILDMCNKYVESEVIRLEQQSFSASSGNEKEHMLQKSSNVIVINDTGSNPSLQTKEENSVLSRLADDQWITGRHSENSIAPSDGRNESEASKRNSKRDRQEKFKSFLCEYLSSHNFCALTEVIVQQALQKFCKERFAKSSLALEAYLIDYIARSNGMFAFGNRCGDMGVTWIFYRPNCADNHFARSQGLPAEQILPDLVQTLLVQLLLKSNLKESLNSLSVQTQQRFNNTLERVADNCRPSVCRALVLAAVIRNLDKFIFSRNEDSISLRKETLQKNIDELRASLTPSTPKSPAMDQTCPLTPPPFMVMSPPPKPQAPEIVEPKSKANLKQEKVIKLIAKILLSHGPCTKTKLREYWLNEAPDEILNVLGSGVSFQLSFRKFEKYFPVNDDGKITVDKENCERFLQAD